jgi:glycosyltransferase involved in cell wall biosynthesis
VCLPDFSAQRPIKIAHAPSAPVAKGTKFITEAISKIKKNTALDFTLIQNVSINDYLRIIEDCDIYIDQLIWGAYGVAAQQAMSLGKPVVCYLKPILTEQLFSREIPLINANPDNIKNVIELLIAQPKQLQTIGLATRNYVKNTHDHLRVAHQLINIYES